MKKFCTIKMIAFAFFFVTGMALAATKQEAAAAKPGDATGALAQVTLQSSKIEDFNKQTQISVGLLIENATKVLASEDTLSATEMRTLIKAFVKAVPADHGNELAHLMTQLLAARKEEATKILEEVDDGFDLRRAMDRLGKN